ncbi:MAG: tyrosine-type recombinase/integrase, partial [Alphaproteobacteria bacterium]
MPLTDLTCRKAKPAPKLYKLSDMNGLQLWVFPAPRGSRLWRFAYRFHGKQKLLALGKYPDVSLSEARRKRDEAKALLAQGGDPCHRKRLQRIEREYPGDSFEIVAQEYVEKLRREGRADATLEKIEWMLGFARPVLGPMTVRSIRPIEILSVLRSVEGRGRYETARKLRSTIGAVCRYAVATARADADPTLALRGAIATPKTKSYAAITDPKAFGALLRAIDGFTGQKTTRAALQLMAMLFPRPGELRAAKWTEFDLDGALWTIPAERTKMRRAHKMPLSRQAGAILRELQSLTGVSEYVFHSTWSIRKPLCENTMNVALRRVGYGPDEMTSHGFRATAATLLNESGLWNPDAIERQLGHVENNGVRRAYARGEHWDERVRMMAWWADYLDRLNTGTTVV